MRLGRQQVREYTSALPVRAHDHTIEEVLADKEVEAVAIATPVQTHHSLARMALQAGKHVLVEKPLADQVALAEDLVSRRSGMSGY